jgi:protocatechuate 3,4-dioxygenase beta subunit
MRGVRIFLLNADRSRARDADGRLVPTLATNDKGRYRFANLQPGRYRVQFGLPRGFKATIARSTQTSKTASKAMTPRTGATMVSPLFSVAGVPHGATRPTMIDGRSTLMYSSIDAGAVPARNRDTMSAVTG